MIKYYLNQLVDDVDGEMKAKGGFQSPAQVLYPVNDLDKQIDEAVDSLHSTIDAYCHLGSNWQIDSIYDLSIKTDRCHPLKPSSYIPTLENIRRKGAILNVQNEDEYCFLWSVVAHIVDAKYKAHRVTEKYKECKKTLKNR